MKAQEEEEEKERAKKEEEQKDEENKKRKEQGIHESANDIHNENMGGNKEGAVR